MLIRQLIIPELHFLILVIHLEIYSSFLVTKIIECKNSKRSIEFLIVPDNSILTSPDVSIFSCVLEWIDSKNGHAVILPSTAINR